MKYKFILGSILGIFFINLISASYPISITPLSPDGSYNINTAYNYVWNFSLDSSCNTILLSNTTSTTTDSAGRGNFQINLDSLISIPYFLCEYRDGAIRKTHTFSDGIFRNIFARNLTIENLNVSDNITAESYIGDGKYLTGIPTNLTISQIANSSLNYTEITFSTYNSTWDETADIVSLGIALANNISSVNNSLNIQMLVNNSINKTNFWNDYDDANQTQFENSNGFLNLKETFLELLGFIRNTNVAF